MEKTSNSVSSKIKEIDKNSPNSADGTVLTILINLLLSMNILVEQSLDKNKYISFQEKIKKLYLNHPSYKLSLRRDMKFLY